MSKLSNFLLISILSLALLSTINYILIQMLCLTNIATALLLLIYLYNTLRYFNDKRYLGFTQLSIVAALTASLISLIMMYYGVLQANHHYISLGMSLGLTSLGILLINIYSILHIIRRDIKVHITSLRSYYIMGLVLIFIAAIIRAVSHPLQPIYPKMEDFLSFLVDGNAGLQLALSEPYSLLVAIIGLIINVFIITSIIREALS